MNVVTFFKCKKKAQHLLLGIIMAFELYMVFYGLNHQKNNYSKIKAMQNQIKQLAEKKEAKVHKLQAALKEKELLTHNHFHQEKVARKKLFLIKKNEFLLLTPSTKI